MGFVCPSNVLCRSRVKMRGSSTGGETDRCGREVEFRCSGSVLMDDNEQLLRSRMRVIKKLEKLKAKRVDHFAEREAGADWCRGLQEYRAESLSSGFLSYLGLLVVIFVPFYLAHECFLCIAQTAALSP